MKEITAILSVLVTIFLTSPVCSAANPAPTAAIVVRLDGDKNIFGGRELALDADGNLFVLVAEADEERRHHLKLSPKELSALLEYIPSSGIREYRQRRDYRGVPEETFPTITLTLSDEKKLIATKGSNEKSKHFDPLYNRLMKLADRAAKAPAYLKQKRDWDGRFP